MAKKVGGSTILVVSKAEAKKYQAHKIAESAGWTSMASPVEIRYVEPIGIKRPWAKKRKK